MSSEKILKHNLSRRSFIGAAGGVGLGALLAACSKPAAPAGSATVEGSSTGSASSQSAASEISTRVATLKGPTSMGLAKLQQDVQDEKTDQSYQFNMYTNPADEVLPLLVKGEVDIACLPANVAAVAYNKTKGGIRVIDINTLSVLYLVSADEALTSLGELAGRTLYVPNKGASPDYVSQFLLKQAGVADQVTIQYASEPTEIIANLAKDPTAAGVLPEPFVTAALTKNESLHRVLNFQDEWRAAVTDGSELVTGVTVARTEFLQEHTDIVEQFLADHDDSVEAVNDDPATYGKVVAELGIVDAAPIATKAIPMCNLACVTGKDMQAALEGYFKVLSDADPKSVGGKLPDDEFYFIA